MSGTATQIWTPERMDAVPGVVVDHRYGVIDDLSETGMSTVCEATNIETKQRVALKTPNDDKAAEYMLHEVAYHRQYSEHPNVVSLDGSGEWGGRPYLASLFQERGTLEVDIRRNPIQTDKDGETVASWVQVAIDECLKIEETTQAIRELNQDQETLGYIVRDLSRETGILDVATDTRAMATMEVVDAVTQAAVKRGYHIESDSPLAVQAARIILEKEKAAAERHASIDAVTMLKRVRILGDVAAATAVLHADDVVHRDIKAANIAIGPDGEGLLFDFGIATRSFDDLGVPAVGSPITVPQESYLGTVVPAGDVFALGVTAYKALTGKDAYNIGPADQVEKNYNTLCRAAVISPNALNPKIHADISRLIVKAISPYYQNRPTAAAMAYAFGLHS